jgi:hypothetical protein
MCCWRSPRRKGKSDSQHPIPGDVTQRQKLLDTLTVVLKWPDHVSWGPGSVHGSFLHMDVFFGPHVQSIKIARSGNHAEPLVPGNVAVFELQKDAPGTRPSEGILQRALHVFAHPSHVILSTSTHSRATIANCTLSEAAPGACTIAPHHRLFPFHLSTGDLQA